MTVDKPDFITCRSRTRKYSCRSHKYKWWLFPLRSNQMICKFIECKLYKKICQLSCEIGFICLFGSHCVFVVMLISILFVSRGYRNLCLFIYEYLSHLLITCCLLPCLTVKYYQGTDLGQCFSTAGPRPGTGPWHLLYRAARGLRKLQYATKFH